MTSFRFDDEGLPFRLIARSEEDDCWVVFAECGKCRRVYEEELSHALKAPSDDMRLCIGCDQTALECSDVVNVWLDGGL